MKDFNNYLFRCSSVGNIINSTKRLSEAQSKKLNALELKETLTKNQEAEYHKLKHIELTQGKAFLSPGSKTYLNELFFQAKWKRTERIETLPMAKGNEKESESRNLLSDVMGEFLLPDTERRSNKWVTGQRDVLHSDLIIDLKTSWTFKTFSATLGDKPLKELYLRQLDSYGDLWGINNALLVYILVDTPIRMVKSEIYKAERYNGDLSIDMIKEIVYNHIYTEKGLESFIDDYTPAQKGWFADFVEIPKESRINIIEHDITPERIEERNECILLAREYLNKLNDGE